MKKSLTMDVELKGFKTQQDNENGMAKNCITHDSVDVSIKDVKTDTTSEELQLESEWARKLQVIKHRVKISFLIVLGVVYFVYFSYAMYRRFGDEGSLRLLVCTVFGVFYLSGVFLLKNESISKSLVTLLNGISNTYSQGKRPKIVRWSLYVVFTIGCIVYIVINVGLKEPGKLRSLLGMVVFVLFMALISNNKRKIKWHTVFWGFVFQFLLGILVLKTQAGKSALNWAADRLTEFMEYSKSGSIFLFGPKYVYHPFAFITLPQIITFCAAIQVLIYLGTIPFIIRTFGGLVAFLLDVSAPEAMNASANILLGGGESAMIIRTYLPDMTNAQLFSTMTNGAASCAGAALIQFMQLGVSPGYLLSASIMSVPAALACAKIIIPDDDKDRPKAIIDDADNNKKESSDDSKEGRGPTQGKFTEPKGIVEAIVIGTKIGMSLCANLIGIMIVFNAMVDMMDATVAWFGDRVEVDITMKMLLGYLFFPVSYIMGVDIRDCRKGGEMVGIKIVSNPLLGYKSMTEVTKNREIFENYTNSYNSSFWHYDGDDVYLEKWNQTLTDGYITERSEVILTYALCGFASLTSLGGSIGVLGALAPTRIKDLSQLVVRSLVAGVIASFLTACVAGLIA